MFTNLIAHHLPTGGRKLQKRTEVGKCAHDWRANALMNSMIKDLKMICNDFLVVKVNCWSYVFNIMKYM